MAMTTTGFSDLVGGSPPILSFGSAMVSDTATRKVGDGSTRWIDMSWEVVEGPIKPMPIKTNCPNCGACYNRWDDDCNYCGTIRV